MYGSNSSKVISTSGILTREMIEDAAKMAVDRHGRPDAPAILPYGMVKELIAWQQREKYWKSLGPLGEKKERLRWRLKHRAKHTVMNLPN
jgi:hypothetical protein